MDTIRLHPDAMSLGILEPVAALIDGIEVLSNSAQLDSAVDTLMQRLRDTFDRAQQEPAYQGFGELFKAMGYSDQVPAGRRLVEGFLENGFKRINNVVDAYNIVSARHACGLGLHDADAVMAASLRLEVFRAATGDSIVPMFKRAAVVVPAGDLVYGDSSQPRTLLAWLGRRDVDNDRFKVTPNTSRVLLVVLGNSQTPRAMNEAVCAEVFDLMRMTCPAARIRLLDTVRA